MTDTPLPAISHLRPSALSPGLRAAVDAVVARAAQDATLACSEVEARRCLVVLAAAVDADEAETEVPVPRGPLARRLVEHLRAELIGAWTDQVPPPEPRHMLGVLAAIERVTARLDAAADESIQVPPGLDVIAGVGHDLRSPLTSILFLAETLHSQQSGEINELQRRQLGIIYSAALGLVSVASDIIELARGGDDLTERTPIPLSVTEILESVHDIVRPMAEEKDLRVQLFPPDVDQRLGYPLALSRVLLNLTTNGLKFTDSGFVELACRATAPNRVEFSVRDTGKGFSPGAIDRIYQPFRRSRDGKKFGFSGSGLGLAISRKLVTAMGSTLEVETRPRWGTRFHFELELPAL
ncbi:MAG: sensor histidine kinase [Longimicrobiales bacterium]